MKKFKNWLWKCLGSSDRERLENERYHAQQQLEYTRALLDGANLKLLKTRVSEHY